MRVVCGGESVMTDTVLTAWLCIYRMQHSWNRELEFCMPTLVRDALIERGWLDDADELTDAGLAVTDMEAAEWGINALEVECD